MHRCVTAIVGAAVLAALAVASGAVARVAEGSTAAVGPRLGPSAVARATATLSTAGSARVRTESWWGGAYTASTGERVHVYLSASYPRDESVGRRWANMIAGLLHGNELSLLRAYIAPHAEVEELCGSRNVLGCYGGQELVSIGESVDGISAEEVVRHEYGHHVAANRQNPPWTAVHWGTKRWASYANVCARSLSGTAFPGDQRDRYTLNPGEAFAEAYRVLNEVRAGAPDFVWDLADYSFKPDAGALAAVEEDVLRPWTQPPPHSVTARFGSKARSWSYVLPTPVDGELNVTLSTPVGSMHGVEVAAGARVLARGLWSGSGKQTLTYRICGERSLTLRVIRRSGPPGFRLRIGAPAVPKS